MNTPLYRADREHGFVSVKPCVVRHNVIGSEEKLMTSNVSGVIWRPFACPGSAWGTLLN